MSVEASPNVGSLYREGRERITELVRPLGDRAEEIPVPACPGWSVKAVVAHLSGVCADILEGRIEGVATDPWTERQVNERRGWSMDKILDEWTQTAPNVEEIAHLFPDGSGVQWLTDLTTHEHDIRAAIEEPGARDAAAVGVALEWLARSFGGRVSPACRMLTSEGDDLVLGEGEPQATVRADRFEFLRALTGRRSEDQIAAFSWDGDHRPHLGAFGMGPFTVATAPLVE